ncbi:hypothetical protein C8P68_102263 [Mucilaginibacter yixingensis]|uniref:Uncharacterized protein n=1 Tax=Mucilaginibacter yixingensis TaxID=1295612 RepID=A0A2T5JCE5_9SPHI|nr:hypothetical protein [Mucilaginibacter yixingensis]PTQ99439.1 hypothetical protein C8P68_102263 [Mucilaginibacter yixingensis]
MSAHRFIDILKPVLLHGLFFGQYLPLFFMILNEDHRLKVNANSEYATVSSVFLMLGSHAFTWQNAEAFLARQINDIRPTLISLAPQTTSLLFYYFCLTTWISN